jgi:hypothetical protein
MLVNIKGVGDDPEESANFTMPTPAKTAGIGHHGAPGNQSSGRYGSPAPGGQFSVRE